MTLRKLKVADIRARREAERFLHQHLAQIKAEVGSHEFYALQGLLRYDAGRVLF